MTGIIKVDTIQNNGGTTGLTIDSNGVVTQPAIPAWRVGLTGNQQVDATGNTTIIFNNSTTSNCFLQGGVTLSSGLITVPVAGVYQMNLVCRFDNVGSGYMVGRLQKNQTGAGTSDGFIIVGNGLSTNYDNLTGSEVFRCAANDTLSVEIFSSADAGYQINNNTTLTGFLVG